MELYMELADLKKLIADSLVQLTEEHPALNFQKIGERAVCFRLAHIIQSNFDKYNVPEGYILDCEYNLNLIKNTSKKITTSPILADLIRRKSKTNKHLKKELNARLVVPDIIIHKRTTRISDNLLVLEVKLSNAKELDLEIDKEKIRLLKEEYGYRYGATLVINRNNPKCIEDLRICESTPS